VGKDQEQHLEMARNFVVRFNHRYGPVFPEPHAFNFQEELVKVPGLDGSGKMSKSEHGQATLYFADEDDVIRKKVMKAKTDGGPTEPNMPMPDYIQNLFQLMELVSDQSTSEKFRTDYNACTIRYGDMKKQLGEDMVKFMSPIRNKTNDILANDEYLVKVMKNSAEKASESARKTMELVRQAVGLNYY
jgi:tryptophanyl-tRNA synthetase